MWYRSGFWVALLAAALVSVSCNKDDILDAATDSDPEGMATVAVSASAGAVSGIVSLISEAAESANKPSLKSAAPAGLVIGAFPAVASMACALGGSIDFTNISDTGFTAQFVNCADGPYVANASAVITQTLQSPPCSEGTPAVDTDVPSALTGTIASGTVTVGNDLTVIFSNFQVEMTNPVYNEGPSGDCGLLSGHFEATGVLTESETETTINLGSGSLHIDYADLGSSGASIAMEQAEGSSLTIDSLCFDGTLNLHTTQDLIYPNNASSPSSGTLVVSGDLNTTVVYPNSDAPCVSSL